MTGGGQEERDISIQGDRLSFLGEDGLDISEGGFAGHCWGCRGCRESNRGGLTTTKGGKGGTSVIVLCNTSKTCWCSGGDEQ